MEEKKQIKISLGTTICIFIIIVLMIALVCMYIYYNKENKDIVNNNKVTNREENNVAEIQNNKIEDENYEPFNFEKLSDEQKCKAILFCIGQLGDFSDETKLTEKEYLRAVGTGINYYRIAEPKDYYSVEEVNKFIKDMFGTTISNYISEGLFTYENGKYKFMRSCRGCTTTTFKLHF